MSAWRVKNWQDVLARVRGALQRRGQTEHEAEDLVHEAWLRLVRYEDEQQPVEQPVSDRHKPATRGSAYTGQLSR